MLEILGIIAATVLVTLWCVIMFTFSVGPFKALGIVWTIILMKLTWRP
jgi:hypothetical protein